MNREQRRAAGKGLNDERVEIAGLVVHFKNGQYVHLDTEKVMVVDRQTGRSLFQEVLEPLPAQLADNANVDVAREAVSQAHEPETQQIVNLDTAKADAAQQYTVPFDTPEGPMEYVKNGNWSGVRPARSKQ